MSNDGQDSDWNWIGHNSKSFAGTLGATAAPSFDFAQGPATIDQLLEWVDGTECECPNVFLFNVKQFTDVIKSTLSTTCIDSSPQPNTHRIWIESRLNNCLELWEKILRADLLGVMKFRKGKFKDREIIVMPTAKQLHQAYGVWRRVFSDDFDDGSTNAWERFVFELQMEDEPLSCLQFESHGVVLPRYLFRAAYQSGHKGKEVTEFFDSNNIAAWFSLFAIYDTFRSLAVATSHLYSWGEGEDKQEFLSRLRDLRDEWVLSFNIAAQWYNNSWLFDEIIFQIRQNIRLKVVLSNTKDAEPPPDKPFQAVGRRDLFKWFMQSSLNLSEEDAWRARYMAQHGESAESIPLPELKKAYSDLFQQAESDFKQSKKTAQELLILRREVQKKIKATRVHQVMAKMIPCSSEYVAGALSKDKGKLDNYSRDVIAYNIKQRFITEKKIQQEKRKLFNSQ